MGTLLAVLLGVAAGFLLLAMPTRMLETVTTTTHLSSLMVQAEPPISPSDKTLLSVLAGILTAGIGWVLIDWLMFGRAGLSALIRTREDEYEDEDDDLYRPTDPLDLVSPVGMGGNEWVPSANGGDARRPLSARTDIGDPPLPGAGFGLRPPAMPGINQPLPALDQMLPGSGLTPPPLQPGFPQPAFAPAAPVFAPMPGEAPTGAPVPSHAAAGQAGAGMPSWLPAPGARPDAPSIGIELPPSLADATPDAAPEAVPQPDWRREPVAPPMPVPVAEQPDPLLLQPAQPPFAQFPPQPLVPPPLIHDAPANPAPQSRWRETLAVPITEPEPAWPAEIPAAAEPVAVAPPAAIAPPPVAAVPPQPASASAPAPAPAARPSGLGFDPAQIEQLLTKLEQTVKRRRAAAAQSQAAQSQAAQSQAAPPRAATPAQPVPVQPAPVAPAEPAATPMPSRRVEPPAAYSAPREIAAPPRPAFDLPPLEPLPGLAPFPQPSLAPAAPPMPAPVVTPAPIAAPIPGQNGDQLLDQPLHMTLDQLRNMVRR